MKEKINLLKIDVEGHELEVIQGSKKIITKFRPIIFFEQQLNDLNPRILFKNSKKFS